MERSASWHLDSSFVGRVFGLEHTGQYTGQNIRVTAALTSALGLSFLHNHLGADLGANSFSGLLGGCRWDLLRTPHC